MLREAGRMCQKASAFDNVRSALMNKKTIALFMLLAASFGFAGCSSGGLNGAGSNEYSATVGANVISGNAYIRQGWSYVDNGSYDSAIVQFNKALTDGPSEQEAAEANNGIGWAKARKASLKSGMTFFAKASELSNDAKVGLAGAYLQQASQDDMRQVIDILANQLGEGKPFFTYEPEFNTGVSNAEVHAMLAYAYAATNDIEHATEQLNYAKELEPEWQGTAVDQLASVIDWLLQ